MKIRQYDPEQHPEKYRLSPEAIEEHGPAWTVTETDRNVTHVVLLGELLGILQDHTEDPHRRVAVNFLRQRVGEALAAALHPDCLIQEAEKFTPGPSDRARRVAASTIDRLIEHGYDHNGLSATAFAIDLACLVAAGERRRLAGFRSERDRTFSKIHSELRDLYSIARDRLSQPKPEGIKAAEGLRWHLYEGGPRAGFSGYLERVGEGAPEGPERVAYWLSADGEVKRPDRPGYPLGGEAPVAGAP